MMNEEQRTVDTFASLYASQHIKQRNFNFQMIKNLFQEIPYDCVRHPTDIEHSVYNLERCECHKHKHMFLDATHTTHAHCTGFKWFVLFDPLNLRLNGRI